MTAASLEFTLPASLEAADPPEARGVPRDGVRMLVSRAASGTVAHHRFADLPRLLLPSDLLVVNYGAHLGMATTRPTLLCARFVLTSRTRSK